MMKDRTKGFLGQMITRDSSDAKLAQVTCFLVGVGVLAASFWRLVQLELNDVQLFFGVLLSLCVPLLFVLLGLLLPISMAAKEPEA